MSQSILSNNLNLINHATHRNKTSDNKNNLGFSRSNCTKEPTRKKSPNKLQHKDPFLNHVLKQINSLKVENLELKKMINERVCSQGRPKSQ